MVFCEFEPGPEGHGAASIGPPMHANCRQGRGPVPPIGIKAIGQLMQMPILVLERTPQPVDEDTVHAARLRPSVWHRQALYLAEAFARVKIDALLKDAGWNLSAGVSVLFVRHADGRPASRLHRLTTLIDQISRSATARTVGQDRPMAALEARRASTAPIAARRGGHAARSHPPGHPRGQAAALRWPGRQHTPQLPRIGVKLSRKRPATS